MIELLIYALALVLMAFVSGNNLTACTGTVINGRILTRKEGIVLSILGYVLGFALQGNLLQVGFAKLLPVASPMLVLIALISSFTVFVMAHRLRVPQSLSIALTTSIIGIDIAYSGTANFAFISTVVSYWILASVVSVLLVAVSMRSSHIMIRGAKVWPVVRAIKVLLVIASFLTAFTLGANTLGFIYATVASLPNAISIYSFAIAILSIALGSMLFSAGELRRVGAEIIPLRYLNAMITQSVSVMLVELGTVFGIPMSTTEIFTAGVYGASLSYKTRLLLKRPAELIVGTWILAAFVSFAFGFLLTKLLIFH